LTIRRWNIIELRRRQESGRKGERRRDVDVGACARLGRSSRRWIGVGIGEGVREWEGR
jgi:hypothetical protein